MKWPVPLNEIKYDEFRRKVGLFLCNKFNVSPDKAFLDPRFQSIYYDESPLVCDYSIVESDRRLIDNVGNAIGAYFYDIQRILKVGYKVGEYQIEMMVDTDGYVSKASIIKDTFKDNALKSLMLDMFMGLYFMPIGGTMQAKLVISVTAKANTEKQ